MCATYKDKSRDTDFEQHANKIFTAIKEIDPAYAEKRAIWELFQNALDIAPEKGVIRIVKTDKGFRFEHNGRPFDDGNLTGLIKQSSNGKTYGSNQNEIGQYGTGFLSTHVYGTKIELTASVQTDSGRIKKLSAFLIDREADNPKQLNKKIQNQDEQAALICDEETNDLEKHLDFTTFEYISQNQSNRQIENMFDYIPSMLAYIFAFNPKLDRVEIDCNPCQTVYQRIEQETASLRIKINSEPVEFKFLMDSIGDVKGILLSYLDEFKRTPKVFLFFPLMDTIDIGINS